MTVTRAVAAAQRKDNGQEQKSDENNVEQQVLPPRPKGSGDHAGPPPRKIARNNKASTQSAPGRGKPTLNRILDMPPEVFNEIARYLMPVDLLSLSRSNRLFRNILLSRSSQHLWRSVLEDVEGLPPCPDDLSEPQYVSLIYSRTCSGCGGRAQRRMDPWLHVRLCPACREKLVDELAPGDSRAPLLPVSDDIFPGKHGAYYLKKDLDELNRLMKQPELKNIGKLSSWKGQRRRDMRDRNEEAMKLLDFLDHMDNDRTHELEALSKQRKKEIEQRLLEEGWTEDDFKPAPESASAWTHLVHQSKPLTDRIWTNIRPKLIPLLEANRAHNEEQDRKKRLAERERHVHDLFNKIRNSLPPLVEITAAWPDEEEHVDATCKHAAGPQTTRIDTPFPTTAELLTWASIQEIVEVDTSLEEVEDAFNQRRGEIDEAISDWRDRVLQEVLDIWHKAPEEESKAGAGGSKGKGKASKSSTQQAKPIPPANNKPRRKSRKGKERASPNYDLTFGTSLPVCTMKFTLPDGTTTEDLDELPDDLRLLLRADTLFTSSARPPFYPDFLPGNHKAFGPHYGPTRDFGQVWDPEEVERDDDGSATARALLELIGVPDATYPQMKASGQAFVCQRCNYELPDSWDSIVSHYTRENARYNLAQEKINSSPGSKFVFNNTHDLSPDNGKPIFKILSPKESAETTLQRVLNVNYEVMTTCKVCEQLGVRASRYNHIFGVQETALMEHIRDAHEIASPLYGKHYKQWAGAPMFFDPFAFDDEEFGEAWDEGGHNSDVELV